MWHYFQEFTLVTSEKNYTKLLDYGKMQKSIRKNIYN